MTVLNTTHHFVLCIVRWQYWKPHTTLCFVLLVHWQSVWKTTHHFVLCLFALIWHWYSGATKPWCWIAVYLSCDNSHNKSPDSCRVLLSACLCNRWLFLLFVDCLLNIPATCYCISGTDLLGHLDMLPHWDRNCRSNFLPHPVTVYWHWANQSRRLAG